MNKFNMNNALLPQDLVNVIGSEAVDFVVKAGRCEPVKKSRSVIFFGIVWTGLASVFAYFFLLPLILGEEVHFKVNKSPVVAGPENLGPAIIPSLIIILFLIIGIAFLVRGVYRIFKKGGLFVSTATRLIHFQNGSIRSINWEDISEHIEVSGDNQKGDINLRLRITMKDFIDNIKKKGPPLQFKRQLIKESSNEQEDDSLEIIYISGIPNVFNVEEVCRRRIKENAPISGQQQVV